MDSKVYAPLDCSAERQISSRPQAGGQGISIDFAEFETVNGQMDEVSFGITLGVAGKDRSKEYEARSDNLFQFKAQFFGDTFISDLNCFL